MACSETACCRLCQRGLVRIAPLAEADGVGSDVRGVPRHYGRDRARVDSAAQHHSDRTVAHHLPHDGALECMLILDEEGVAVTTVTRSRFRAAPVAPLSDSVASDRERARRPQLLDRREECARRWDEPEREELVQSLRVE